MATIEQRITALEQRVNQSGCNYHIVFCKGETPTLEEKAEADAVKSKLSIFILHFNPVGG